MTSTHRQRRRLLAGIAAVFVVSPVDAQGARPRILWLSLIPPAGRAGGLVPFLEGMAAHGYGVGAFDLDEAWGDNSRETLERRALEALARNANRVIV